MNQVQKGILFVSRNYPPQIGGLETFSYSLIHQFQKHGQCYKIVLKKNRNHLIWFIPYLFVKALVWQKRYDIGNIHLCDAVLSPVGVLLGQITRARISITIHGLDITYPNLLYQKIIPWCISRLDKVVCVSKATRFACLDRDIPFEKCLVIPNGVDQLKTVARESRENCRRLISKQIGIDLIKRKLLLTVGRLVERKGIAWFVEEVMPKLDNSFVYIVAGDGPEGGRIERIIKENRLEYSVILMGRVSDETRNRLFHSADIFVMPNITVRDDIEGFGIVAIEAGSCGLPVVASNLQGIRDAVLDGKTGYLVEEKNVNGFAGQIAKMDLKRNDVRLSTSVFYWENIYDSYRETLSGLLRK